MDEKATRRWGEWGVVLALFGATTFALFWITWPVTPDKLGGDLVNIITVLMKQEDPELFRRDFVLADLGNVRFYPPLFGRLLLATFRWTGDWVGAARVWVVPLALGYLVGVYAFLRSVVRQAGAAVLTAMVSLPPITTLGATYWGVGPLKSVQARSLFLPLVPVLVMLFRRWEDDWKLPLVFALLGVSSSLHPVSAVLLAAPLGLMLVLRRGLRRSAWAKAGLCALAFVAGATPFLWRFVSATRDASAGVSGRAANAIVREHIPHQFLSSLPVSFWSLGGWVLVIAAAGLGWRVRRRLLDDRDRFLGWFALSVVVTSLGGMAAVELVSAITGRPYAAINLLRGFRYVFLAYYAYMALLVAEALTWLRRRPAWKVAACAVLACVVAPAAVRAYSSLGIRQYRWAVRTGRGKVMLRYQRRSLPALCTYVEHHTRKDALFHFWDTRHHSPALRFRFLAARSVTVSAKDAGYLWYADKARLLVWHERVRRIRSEYDSRDAGRVAATAREYGADYVVVPSDWELIDLPVHYREERGYTVYALREASAES